MEKLQGYYILEKQIELLAKESAARAAENQTVSIYGMSATMAELAATILLLKLPLTANTKKYLSNQIKLLVEMSGGNETSPEKLIKCSEAMCALAYPLFKNY